jgi:hypothetical protein
VAGALGSTASVEGRALTSAATAADRPPTIALGEIKSVNSEAAARHALNDYFYQYGLRDIDRVGTVLYDAQGNVTMKVYEAGGEQRLLWEGKIGQVAPDHLPAAAFGTSAFGNAIEARVREIVEQATGREFMTKHPSAPGADLVPVPYMPVSHH